MNNSEDNNIKEPCKNKQKKHEISKISTLPKMYKERENISPFKRNKSQIAKSIYSRYFNQKTKD